MARLPFSWPQTLGMSCLVWAFVALLHSTAHYSDQLRRGGPAASLLTIIDQLALAYVPWVLFSSFLLRLFSNRAARLNQPPFVAWTFLAVLVGYLIPQSAYQIGMAMWEADEPWSLFWSRFTSWPATYWLIDCGLLVLTFIAVYALVASAMHREAHALRLKAEAEALSLRLELEQQRLRALQGQLEPHFMFNALNAISGLVRGDDKSLALNALQRLSALLRYALSASTRDFVTLGEELDFVLGYIRLQTLRFGDRLRVDVDEGPNDLRAADFPPLLLQPLVENAIRHDLEGHEDSSRISLSVRRERDRVVIEVKNPCRPGTTPNPGAGLGLKSTRERLQLLYDETAECVTSLTDGHFVATLTLPMNRPREA